jgi:uncharacterized protein
MRIRHNSRVLAAFVVLVGLVAGLGAQVPATPAGKTQRFFWKVTSPTTEVYLLGSIHVATDDMYPLPAEIEKAYQEAKDLVVEADVTKVNQLTLALQVMQMGMYPQGDSLDKHISPETMTALRAYGQANGIPPTTFATMKPVMAAMTVDSLFLANQGLDETKGIDLHFLNQANTAKDKTIVELESADYQMKLLFSIDDKLAEKWLKETLKDSSRDELDKTVQAWKDGDDKKLVALMEGDEKTDADAARMNDLLIYKRNDGMTGKIEEMLKGKDKALVVVGAAHLIGGKGILRQLEGKGYKVERPTLTVPPVVAPVPRPAATGRAPAGVRN